MTYDGPLISIKGRQILMTASPHYWKPQGQEQRKRWRNKGKKSKEDKQHECMWKRTRESESVKALRKGWSFLGCWHRRNHCITDTLRNNSFSIWFPSSKINVKINMGPIWDGSHPAVQPPFQYHNANHKQGISHSTSEIHVCLNQQGAQALMK